MYQAWSSSQKATELAMVVAIYDRYLEDFTGKTVSTIYSIQQKEFQPDAFDQAVQEVLVYEVTLWSSLSCDQHLVARHNGSLSFHVYPIWEVTTKQVQLFTIAVGLLESCESRS